MAGRCWSDPGKRLIPFMPGDVQIALKRWLQAGRGPVWTMLSQVLTSVANFLFSIIIVRSLGLAEFGQFSLCFLLMMLNRKFLLFSFLTPIGAI